ncbi:hypothetical protein [Leptospira noguchii]|uniref:hypothetical protein n=1 Tax=Leptospira noguchii TaxID=28182 RepID=UPI001FB58C7D|nr:hypothetical protein [Leptospira noguchii]UOG54022.1 hypothetical protein MAL09_07990 [Leptospira noguchii]
MDKIWKSGINEFNQFYDSEILGYSDDIDYLLSGVATRDVYLSRIYESICYVKFLRKVNNSRIIQSVEVENLTIGKMLKNDHKLKGVKIIFSIKKRFKEVGLLPITFLFNIYLIIKEFVLVRFYLTSYKIPNDIILFDSFLLESSFSKDKFKDIYYPGLQEIIQRKPNVFYLFTILLKKYRLRLSQLKKTNIRFIHRFQFLKLFDVLIVAMRPLVLLKYIYNYKLVFQDIDITKSFRYELLRTSVIGQVLNSFLNYRFVYRLKQKKINIEKFIDWFENQQTDRGFALGLKRFYKNSLYCGCLGSIPIKTQFHLFPTEKELCDKLVPERIFVPGPNHLNDYSEHCKNLILNTMPAFRYAHLFDELDLGRPDIKNFEVLVALPMEIIQSFKIIRIVKRARILLNYKITFYLKFHPAYSVEQVNKFLNDNNISEFPILGGDIGDCLYGKSLLISSTSSTCLESLASGIPVLIVANNGVTHLPFSEKIPREIWSLCYDEQDIIKEIDRFSNNYDYALFQVIAKKVKKENFTRLDSFSLEKFLNVIF